MIRRQPRSPPFPSATLFRSPSSKRGGYPPDFRPLGKVASSRVSTNPAAVNSCRMASFGLTESQKDAILQELTAAGLVDTRDDATFPNGLKSGGYPPLLEDGDRKRVAEGKGGDLGCRRII